MSRTSSRAQTPSRISQNRTQPSSPIQKLNNINSIIRILFFFICNKHKYNKQIFFKKCKGYSHYIKKRSKIINVFFHNIYIRKFKQYQQFAMKKIISFQQQLIKKQNQMMETKKLIIKNKCIMLLGITFNKLYLSKLKIAFQIFSFSSKFHFKLNNFKIKHLGRIFQTLLKNKLKLGFDFIKKRKVAYLYFKNSLKRIQKLLTIKRQRNISDSFLKMQLYIPSNYLLTPKSPSPSKSRQSSPNRLIAKKIANFLSDKQQKPQQQQLKAKNKKLQEQIKLYRQSTSNEIQLYKKKLHQYETQCQKQKIAGTTMEQTIRQLSTQISKNKQKVLKNISNIQLWDYIYSNFLLLLRQYIGQSLPKQKILEHLQYPLVPLNTNIDAIKLQNKLLTKLLSEYQKYYGVSESVCDGNLLSYDLLSVKNKFYYAIIQILISDGIGNQHQLQALQTQLKNKIQQF